MIAKIILKESHKSLACHYCLWDPCVRVHGCSLAKKSFYGNNYVIPLCIYQGNIFFSFFIAPNTFKGCIKLRFLYASDGEVGNTLRMHSNCVELLKYFFSGLVQITKNDNLVSCCT